MSHGRVLRQQLAGLRDRWCTRRPRGRPRQRNAEAAGGAPRPRGDLLWSSLGRERERGHGRLRYANRRPLLQVLQVCCARALSAARRSPRHRSSLFPSASVDTTLAAGSWRARHPTAAAPLAPSSAAPWADEGPPGRQFGHLLQCRLRPRHTGVLVRCHLILRLFRRYAISTMQTPAPARQKPKDYTG